MIVWLISQISMNTTLRPGESRISEKRKMQTKFLGALALPCAAVDEVASWILLAVALTFVSYGGNAPSSYLRSFGLGLLATQVLHCPANWPLARLMQVEGPVVLWAAGDA